MKQKATWLLSTVGVGWIAFGVIFTADTLYFNQKGVCPLDGSKLGMLDSAVLLFCVTASIAGYGVLRRWRWAIVTSVMIYIICLLYAFLGMCMGPEGISAQIAFFILFVFSAASLIAFLIAFVRH
jgi:hypothetical protein